MIKFRRIFLLGFSVIILAACESPENNAQQEEKTNLVSSSEIIEEEPGLQELDEVVTNEISKIGTDEEIDWEKINLNKRQFREFIESLSDMTTEEYDGEEQTIAIISSTMTDDDTIEFIINNPDKSEMSALSNGLFALVMDSFSRQMYLSSDFSDGNTHPTIYIKDNVGNIISEASDFIEMEDTE
ncbi:hypothetical protein [Jeotgalibaca sp. A127]|uniref:hypothetical protein n=1 Tax=Jeotgalibaca sp. A127 TaxID=3457324 RepID=UPI003FD681C2